MSVSARSRCGPGHSDECPGAVPAIVMSMLAGAAMIFGIKCGDAAKFWAQKMVPMFAIKTAMDSCSLTVYIFHFPNKSKKVR